MLIRLYSLFKLFSLFLLNQLVVLGVLDAFGLIVEQGPRMILHHESFIAHKRKQYAVLMPFLFFLHLHVHDPRLISKWFWLIIFNLENINIIINQLIQTFLPLNCSFIYLHRTRIRWLRLRLFPKLWISFWFDPWSCPFPLQWLRNQCRIFSSILSTCWYRLWTSWQWQLSWWFWFWLWFFQWFWLLHATNW